MIIVLKEYAKSIKKTLLLEIFQGKDVERKNQLFIKLGFKPLGGIYGFFI